MKVRKIGDQQPEFNYRMITLARESRGLTQKELASVIDYDQGNLSKIENGMLAPAKEIAEKIAKALQYPLSFFRRQDYVQDLSSCYYRKRLQAPKKEILKSEANINITRMSIEKLLLSVELPAANYPLLDMEEGSSPENAARYVREYWKIPAGRIDNLTKAVEDNGILVINTEFEEAGIDGLSVVTEKKVPIIFINKAIPADRYRLTLAHELGHLVMHIGRSIPESRDVEKEAFLFAAELLMPGQEIKEQLVDLNLEKLAELKKYWHISMGALLKRAQVLEVITQNQYQYLWQQMGKHGYKRREPEELDFPKEVPTLLKEIFDAHMEELQYSEKELAEFLCLRYEEFTLKYMTGRGRLKLIKGGARDT